MATQIVAGRNREVGVTLSPAGQGRYEIYLDGELIYNRKEPPADIKDAIGDARGGVSIAEYARTKLLAALERAGSSPPAGH
jgi:hypothetical protein